MAVDDFCPTTQQVKEKKLGSRRQTLRKIKIRCPSCVIFFIIITKVNYTIKWNHIIIIIIIIIIITFFIKFFMGRFLIIKLLNKKIYIITLIIIIIA